jgi:beta-1,4-mannooligosaccharide phosphorylase
VVGVEQWAEIRRLYFVGRLSIKEIVRRTGHGLASLLTEPILRPELPWERFGDVDNVVFVQGAVPRPDGTIYLTYGAADRCVGAANVVTAEVVGALRTAA